MKVLLVTATLATAAVLGTMNPAASAQRRVHGAAANEYLYVATYADNQQVVLRFPFVNGFPARNPDLTFNNLTNPMAVGDDGTFYATVPLPCCYGLGTIEVFPPNSTVVERQITLPNLNESTTIDTALVEGPDAYLYVGYAAFISGAEPHGRRAPKVGVAIYPPSASGGGPPLAMFDVPRDLAGPNALAFDQQGLLHVSTESSDDLHNRIWTVTSPLNGRSLSGVLKLAPSDNAEGLEFSDGGRSLYALEFGPPSSRVAVYPSGAHGHQPPSRQIVFPSTIALALGFGVDDRHVYVAQYAQPAQVVGYVKYASGPAKPVYTLMLGGSITAIALGP
jgi:hypothetical protein